MAAVHKSINRIYGILLFFITLTGFAQMPIFKRYYIADIPGFGWLAQYYVTHVMHYIFASLLIALCCYGVLDFVLSRRSLTQISVSGLVKGMILLGLMVSGGLMVTRNLPGVYFSHILIYAMNISHIGLCMALITASFYTLVKKKAWLK